MNDSEDNKDVLIKNHYATKTLRGALSVPFNNYAEKNFSRTIAIQRSIYNTAN